MVYWSVAQASFKLTKLLPHHTKFWDTGTYHHHAYSLKIYLECILTLCVGVFCLPRMSVQMQAVSGGHKRESDTREPELQVIVNCQTRVLRLEPRSSVSSPAALF